MPSTTRLQLSAYGRLDIRRSGIQTLTAVSVRRCCHRHDCCYGDAERFGCHTKTDQYRWKCEEKTAACGEASFFNNLFPDFSRGPRVNPTGRPPSLRAPGSLASHHFQPPVTSKHLLQAPSVGAVLGVLGGGLIHLGGRLSNLFSEHYRWQTSDG